MFAIRGTENLLKLQILDDYMIGHKGFIAGGCFKNLFNGEIIKDVDIFFENETDYVEAEKYYDKSDNFKFYYKSNKIAPEESIVYKVIHHKDFFEHLFFKRLVIDDALKFPISTFERAFRYKGYGYSLCRESKAKLIEAIKASPINENLSQSLYDGLD